MSSPVVHNYPISWETEKLGILADSEKGKRPTRLFDTRSSIYSIPYVDIEAFEKGIVRSWTDGEGCRMSSDTDFVMVWDGSRSGLVGKGMKGALGSTLVKITFPLIHDQYAFYFLQSKFQQINSRTKGSGTPHVDPNLLWEYEFPIPPISEQHRIVTKIKELFSELDKGIESLKTARAQLAVYRQAVLKHAFEGKLTADWREKNKDKLETPEQLLARIKREREAYYERQLEEWKAAVKEWEEGGRKRKKPIKPKLSTHVSQICLKHQERLPTLPSEWLWVELSRLFRISPQNGVYKPSKEYGSGTQIIRIDDFYDGQLIRRTGFKRLRLSDEEIEKYKVQESDLIVNRVNSIEHLGKCALIENLTETTVFESNIMRCNVIVEVISQSYLTAYLVSREGRERLTENAKHAVNQASINQMDVGNTIVPITSMEEQRLIVLMIDQQLSKADALIAQVDVNLKKAELLRQSILKKAFSGQLVPQDPNDEPASVLLERIRAEKMARSKGKTAKRRQPKAATV